MSDREARALAAGDEIEVNGISYRLRPAVAQHLCDLERDALRHFKREYLQSYRDGLSLMENGDAKGLYQKKLEEVAAWDLSCLPQKDAYDVSMVPITAEVKAWLKSTFGTESENDDAARALLGNALDTRKLTSEQVVSMSGGVAPFKGRIRYDQWWVTASFEGQVSFLTTSVRYEHKEITSQDVAGWPISKIIEGAKMVERLTTAELGNISDSLP